MKKKIFVSIILSLLLINVSFSQSSSIDTNSVSNSKIYAVDSYYRQLNENLGLNNGREYVDYDINIKGHQYFQTDEFEEGTVVYEGTLYKDIPLLYDIVK